MTGSTGLWEHPAIWVDGKGFLFLCGGWHPFVDGLRSTETVSGKPASATRTPTSVTSYTTDFISLRYVSRRDVGCRKPTACFSSFNILTTISHPPPSHGPSFSQFNPLALGWPAWRPRRAAGWREDSDDRFKESARLLQSCHTYLHDILKKGIIRQVDKLI